jgi:hypothetical protein
VDVVRGKELYLDSIEGDTDIPAKAAND